MTETHGFDAAQPGENRPFAFIPAPWSPGQSLWLLLLVFTISAAGSLTARSIIGRPFSDTISSVLVGLVLVAGYLVELAVVHLMARSKGVGFSASVGLVPPARGSVLTWVTLAVIGALIARGFASLYAGMARLLPISLPDADSNPLSLFPGGGWSLAMLFLVVVVIAPFTEEVVFRGVLLSAFGARWGVVVGVVTSSAMFAALHFSAYVFVPIAAAALVFGWLFVRFQSLWPAYVAHATFNGIAVLLLIVLQAQGLV